MEVDKLLFKQDIAQKAILLHFLVFYQPPTELTKKKVAN